MTRPRIVLSGVDAVVMSQTLGQRRENSFAPTGLPKGICDGIIHEPTQTPAPGKVTIRVTWAE